MFKNLHLQLTAFCTLVTSLILIAMTCVCLYISESDTVRQSFLFFENNIHSMLSYLESQSVISHQWLLEFQSNYGFQILIKDGNTPLYYNTLNYDQKTEQLFEKAQLQAKEEFEIEPSSTSGNRLLTENVEFRLKGESQYYASVATIPRSNSYLNVTVLYSVAKERALMIRQRLLFGLAITVGIILLAVFSWFFTRHALIPVEESRRRQTEFIASASHELRSPLTVILSSLSAMEDAPLKKQQEFTSIIRKEGQRMNRLVGDLLSLANADNNNWSFSPCEVEPDTFLLNVYEKYQPHAREKQIRLDIQLPEDMVPTCQLDADRMDQVMGILIDNALYYTPEGGQILLELRQKGNRLEYRVADNGPGISDKEKSRIFQRFYRVDKSHHDKNHYGLGLCIAEEIVRMHGGKIHVIDTPKGGATFVISL